MPQRANLDQPRPHLNSAHPLQSCWDLQLAGLGADALQVALECALFDHLGAPVSAPALASSLALDAASTGYLLELLWSLGLLAARRGTLKSDIPFGPFMLAGSAAAMLLLPAG